TLHPTPCDLHPAPCTLQPTPCTLHPTPYPRRSATGRRHPPPSRAASHCSRTFLTLLTLHPPPSTLHPPPSTPPTPYPLIRLHHDITQLCLKTPQPTLTGKTNRRF
ncbi:hypothetical protein T484DRAFT_3636363, partial [Baffinella frigidus]